MGNIIIRKGKLEDSIPSNFLIYSTGSYFFDHVFYYEKEKIFVLLKQLFEKNKGVFSHKFSSVAELDGKVVGIEHGYTKNERAIHSLFSSLYIIRQHRLGEIAGMLRRNYHLGRFIKKIHPDSYYIAHLAVLQEFHGKGIGTKLLENSFKKAISLRSTSCLLDVSIHNKNAIKLYEKMGFKIFKEIRNPALEEMHKLHGQYRMIKRLT